MEGGDYLKWHLPVWGDICGVGGSNAEEWGDNRKKDFFINNSVGLSICDGLIETVKCTLVNI